MGIGTHEAQALGPAPGVGELEEGHRLAADHRHDDGATDLGDPSCHPLPVPRTEVVRRPAVNRLEAQRAMARVGDEERRPLRAERLVEERHCAPEALGQRRRRGELPPDGRQDGELVGQRRARGVAVPSLYAAGRYCSESHERLTIAPLLCRGGFGGVAVTVLFSIWLRSGPAPHPATGPPRRSRRPPPRLGARPERSASGRIAR
jgi:hypothetical protein